MELGPSGPRRPRVLLLSPYYSPVLGGAERAAGQVADALRRAGMSVQVLTKRVSRALPRTERVDGIAVRRIPPVGMRSPLGKWLMLPTVLLALVWLADSFDVICCVDYRGVGLAAVIAGWLIHRPVVFQAQTTGVMSDDDEGTSLEARSPWRARVEHLLRAPLRRLYAHADAFACISHGIERETLAAHVPPARVHYVPNSVDSRRFHPVSADERGRRRRELGWPDDRVIGVFVGRLSLEKGVLDLIEAWASVDARACLVVVGPDMPGHRWDAGLRARRMVADRGLTARVRFYGPTNDIAPLLNGADFLVQPSRFEAFGISAVEALAAGLPVVATAVGGLPEFVIAGETGLLCAPSDPAGLAAEINRLVADPDLRRRLGEHGRALVEREFDAGRVGSRLAELVQAAALSASGRARSPRSAGTVPQA